MSSSQIAGREIRILRDVMIPMRDGVRLATDLWLPGGDEPRPTLLIRLAVGKDTTGFWGSELLPNSMALLDAGYAVAWQDSRGNGASEGVWRMMGLDADDGEDTVTWIAQQIWSDGRVGGFGPSHMGIAQWAIAATGNPAYRCFAPVVAPWDYYRYMTYSEGGALELQAPFMTAAVWGHATARRSADGEEQRADRIALAATMRNIPAARGHLPLTDHPEFDTWAPWWPELLAHPSRDEYWQALSHSDRAASISIPALSIGGWFDPCLSSTIDGYETMRQVGATDQAREGQRLIIGPWDHISYAGTYPDRSFGPAANVATIDLTSEYLAFYDRWLRDDAASESPGHSRVKLFVMGIDRWRDEDDWPLPDTVYTDYFLASTGSANCDPEGGVLRSEPATTDGSDSFTYDPRRPITTLGGPVPQSPLGGKTGPVDQRGIEARDDVLCYTSAVLDAPAEVVGWVSLVLHFSSSALDTDIVAKVVDVTPEGKAIYLCDGILRARYRNSLERPEPLEPGQVYEVTLRLRATANVFLPGHRIRLDVMSSNYPRYTRNTNTGGLIAEETEADMIVAVNRVHHGPAQRSRLVLPVISR